MRAPLSADGVGLGVTFGVLALAAGFILYIRSREKRGRPIWVQLTAVAPVTGACKPGGADGGSLAADERGQHE